MKVSERPFFQGWKALGFYAVECCWGEVRHDTDLFLFFFLNRTNLASYDLFCICKIKK